MVAKIAWWNRIATLASHDPARVSDEHPPATISDLRDLKPQHIAGKPGGLFELKQRRPETGVEDHGSDCSCRCVLSYSPTAKRTPSWIRSDPGYWQRPPQRRR